MKLVISKLRSVSSLGAFVIFAFLVPSLVTETRAQSRFPSSKKGSSPCEKTPKFPSDSIKLPVKNVGLGGYLPRGIFFDDKEFDVEDDIRKYLIDSIDWGFSSALKEIDEKPLIFETSETTEIYRLLFLPSFHNRILVRIEKKDGGYVLKVGEFKEPKKRRLPWKKIRSRRMEIPRNQWCDLITHIEKANFWRMKPKNCFTCYDGFTWMFEGVKLGRYQAVERWSPQSGNYRKLCVYLLELSGFFRTEGLRLY